MLKCKKCNIEYNGNLKYCPLCQAELTGTVSESVFPKLKKEKKGLLYKILLYVSLFSGILFTFIEYTVSKSFYISKFVWLGLITNYILIRILLENYKNPLKILSRYFLIILIVFFVLYFIIKKLFITTYLIPILCLVIFVFNSITMMVLKDNYIKTIILNFFIGVIPLLLVYFKLSTFELLSYIFVVVHLLIFLGLIIFYHNNILEELKKLFSF